jgi:DNA (cytosine-5)-methyltransferase 1
VPARFRVIDLFAGAGGLSEGFSNCGSFKAIAAVENDVCSAATYAANHPETPLYVGDIADWVRQRSAVAADVVVGGPPCQGFSNLGARRVRDPRNALWRRYVEALVRIRPLVFVLENVADFVRSGQFRDLRRETYRGGRLAEYRIEYGVLNAAEFGVPQIRKRTVVIGSHRDLPAPGLPLGPRASRPSDWTTVKEIIGDLPFETEHFDLPATSSTFAGRTIKGPFRTVELHIGRRPTDLSLARYRAIPEGGNRIDLPDDLLAPCWRKHKAGSRDVMGRLHWNRPAVTIRTEFWKPEKGRYLHPTAHRAITHLEAARLQGFSDEYIWFGSKIEIGRQIGNAVPVQLAAGIAAHIASQLT